MLEIVPITLTKAREYCHQHHSHLSGPSQAENCMLACAVASEGKIVCVCVASRPRARMLCDGETIEIVRVASDGSTPHAASKALATLTSVAIKLGWKRIISYTLLGESGTIYKAAGWKPTALSGGGEWGRPSRRRETVIQPGQKIRWETGPNAAPEDPKVMEFLKANAGQVEIPKRCEPSSSAIVASSTGIPSGSYTDSGL